MNSRRIILKGHFAHALGVAIAVCATIVPTVLASPAALDFLKAHPGFAVYVPLAAGALSALVKALHAPPGQPPPPTS